MSRHTEIPPFARQYSPSHSTERHRLLNEIEYDPCNSSTKPPYRVVPFSDKTTIGWEDARGNIHFFDDEPHQTHFMFWLSVVSIVLILGLGAGYCLS